jgi:hypothetical protein
VWKLLTAIALVTATSLCDAAPGTNIVDVHIRSLSELSVKALRQRTYQTSYELLQNVTPPEETGFSLMLGYVSDGLNLYMRLDLPSRAPPESGFPVLVFAPGWIPREDSPEWDFGLTPGSFSHRTIEDFKRNGFAVITAGYRGRGTVNGVQAQGIEFRDAWGNGSYLSPIFYSIDLLNLISGVALLDQLEWQKFLQDTAPRPKFDLQRISLLGHSQGGDVALNTLAVLGNNPGYPHKLVGASIWSGNIPDRFTQANTFGPMGSTLQAFMSGDGSWTGSAVGGDGTVNPDFVFPWPADWIGTLDTHSSEWSWQAETWATPTVADALQRKYSEMYATLNRYVDDVDNLKFTLFQDEHGSTRIGHSAPVAELIPKIGGFNYHKYVKTPLLLHISDRDYYSIPAWNTDLAARINADGGFAQVYTYAGNTHSLQASKHRWFSPAGTVDGAPMAVQRDTNLFLGNKLPASNQALERR